MFVFNYLIIFLVVLSSFMVVFSMNAVHSVYFLILVFCLSSILFVVEGAEFIAVLLIIVYVGAVSILFLFVVMLLNLRIMELHSQFFHYLPVGIFVGIFFFLELFYICMQNFNLSYLDSFSNYPNLRLGLFSIYNYKGQTAYLGFILYNYYAHFVIIASIILLLAMFGVIALTVDLGYRQNKKITSYISVKRNIRNTTYWSTALCQKS